MNSTEIFQMALSLQSPYKITQVELQSDNSDAKSLHIYIDFERGSKFMDESQELCSVHDTVERTWRHLNFFSTSVIYIVEFLVLQPALVKFNK